MEVIRINKKLIVSTIMAAVTAVVLPAAAFAQFTGTIVKGFVYDPSNGNAAVANASVNVTCNGNSIPTTTNGIGKYSVTYTLEQCNDGDPVNVTASSGSLQGNNAGTIENITTDINIGVVNVFLAQVPEFGAITGAMALLTSGGSFLAFRRMKAKA